MHFIAVSPTVWFFWGFIQIKQHPDFPKNHSNKNHISLINEKMCSRTTSFGITQNELSPFSKQSNKKYTKDKKRGCFFFKKEQLSGQVLPLRTSILPIFSKRDGWFAFLILTGSRFLNKRLKGFLKMNGK